MCRGCGWKPRIGRRSIFLWPAAHRVRLRLFVISVAGLVVATATADRPWPRLLDEVMPYFDVAFLSGPMLVFAGLASMYLLWIPERDVRWKASILRTHGLAPSMSSDVFHCLACPPPRSLRDLLNLGEVGVVAVGPGGLVFMGEASSRSHIPASRIERSEARAWWLVFPPRFVVKVTLTDGSVRSFMPLERGSTRGNSLLARELVRRMAQGVTHFGHA